MGWPIFRGELLVLGSVKDLAQGLSWLDFVIGLIGFEMVAVEKKTVAPPGFLGISEVSKMMLHIWNSFIVYFFGTIYGGNF